MRRALFVLLTLSAAGCVQATDFNPVGPMASIAGSWTIDGAQATDDNCKLLMAPFSTDPPEPRVRVVFLDELRPVAHGSLIFECSVGSFDTGEGLVVADGTWTVRLEAIDSAGRPIATGPEMEVDATTGRIDLASTPFLSGLISVSTAIGNTLPTTERCAELGIAEVAIAFDVAGGAIATSAREPCGVGGVGTRLAPATYTAHVRASDTSGIPIIETTPMEYVVAPGQHVDLGVLQLAP